MKTKAVYVNETLVGEAATWAAVYKLVSDKDVTFVGTPETAEGPAAFFLRGQVDKSRQSLLGVHSEVMPTITPTDFGASMRAKAIARGLINTERAAKRLHLEPIREVSIHDEGAVNRRSMSRIIARRMKATAFRA